MFKRVYTCFLISLFFDAVSYSYDHLPLCARLQNSFPKINAACFIIVESKTGTILHEKNSLYKIRIHDNRHKESLHDIVSKYKTFSAKSQISGLTFIFNYVNKHKCVFEIALSGIDTPEQFESDKQKLSAWLDQFFLFKVCKKNEILAEIPVLYSIKLSKIDMRANKDIFILLSDEQSNNITKSIKYRSVVTAPFTQNTLLGSINILTDTFINPVSINIRSLYTVGKGSPLKIFMDSLKYLIFGTNF